MVLACALRVRLFDRCEGGPSARSIAQTTPCDAWGYDGGFIFENLTPGAEMTLEVSAPGYSVYEKTVVPSSGPQMSVLFTPARDQLEKLQIS
ncbi:MAG: hypothetical protein WKF55_12000 [Gemmatimonadaceae bacterium]